MIKDPDLMKRFLRNIPSIGRIGQESYGHKQRVQLLLDRDVLDMLRGSISHFVRDPTLIFKALVMLKYKSDARIGWNVIYGAGKYIST